MDDNTGRISFVAGATGLTGREVVRLLAQRGDVVTAHVRPDSSRLDEWTERFTAMGATVDSTPWDEAAMTATLTTLAPHRVFGLLGTTAKRARAARSSGEDASYEAVDYGLTALLYRASQAAGCTPTFVYLSSAGVSDRAPGAYLRARAKVERDLRAGDLPYVVARPSFIVGDRDTPRPTEKVGSVFGDAALALLGAVGAKRTASKWMSLTGEALAAGMIALSDKPGSAGRIFDSADLREAALTVS